MHLNFLFFHTSYKSYQKSQQKFRTFLDFKKCNKSCSPCQLVEKKSSTKLYLIFNHEKDLEDQNFEILDGSFDNFSRRYEKRNRVQF